jgi:hypothetical protein
MSYDEIFKSSGSVIPIYLNVTDMSVSRADLYFGQKILDLPPVALDNDFDRTIIQIGYLSGNVVMARYFQCPVPEADTLDDPLDNGSGADK